MSSLLRTPVVLAAMMTATAANADSDNVPSALAPDNRPTAITIPPQQLLALAEVETDPILKEISEAKISDSSKVELREQYAAHLESLNKAPMLSGSGFSETTKFEIRLALNFLEKRHEEIQNLVKSKIITEKEARQLALDLFYMPTAKRIVTGEAEEVNSLYMKKVELLLNAIKTAEGSPNMTKLLEAIPHYMEQLNTEKKLRRFETQLSIQPLHEMLECGL